MAGGLTLAHFAHIPPRDLLGRARLASLLPSPARLLDRPLYHGEFLDAARYSVRINMLERVPQHENPARYINAFTAERRPRRVCNA